MKEKLIDSKRTTYTVRFVNDIRAIATTNEDLEEYLIADIDIKGLEEPVEVGDIFEHVEILILHKKQY